MSIVQFFATIAPIPILFPAIIGVRKFSNAARAEKRIIVLVIFALITQIVATILWWKTINNLFISHYFTIFEGYLLLGYFAHYLSNKAQKWTLFLTICFVIFSVSQVFFSFPDLGINAASKGLESIILIGVSLVVWRKIMQEYTDENLLSKPLFWMNSAVLVYFSASILLFIFSESIIGGKHPIRLSLWAIHLFFMTIYYVLIGIGLWKITQK